MKKLIIFRLGLSASLTYLTIMSANADVRSWRNDRVGKYLNSNSPIEWAGSTVWETPLSSTSNASPILVKNKLYFTSEPANLICADSKSGKILWTRSNEYLDLLDLTEEQIGVVEDGSEKLREINKQIDKRWNDIARIRRRSQRDDGADNSAANTDEQAKRDEIDALTAERLVLLNDPNIGKAMFPPTHAVNGYSSYTPVSDGERVYASFGLGVVVAYDLNGNRLWHSVLDKTDHIWGGSTMPLLVDGKLIVRFSDYVALNPRTGEEIWRTPSEPVLGTPTIFSVQGQSFLFTPRGDVIRVSNGEVLQDSLVQIDVHNQWSAMNTPVLEGNILYNVRGVEGGDGIASAYRIPNDIESLERAGLELVWETDVSKESYYSSCIVHEGLMYTLSRLHMLTVLESETGNLIYQKRIEGLNGPAFSNLSLVGDQLVFGAEQGAIVVIEKGRNYKEVSRSQIGALRSTPIFDGNIAYVRTFDGIRAVSADK